MWRDHETKALLCDRCALLLYGGHSDEERGIERTDGTGACDLCGEETAVKDGWLEQMEKRHPYASVTDLGGVVKAEDMAKAPSSYVAVTLEESNYSGDLVVLIPQDKWGTADTSGRVYVRLQRSVSAKALMDNEETRANAEEVMRVKAEELVAQALSTIEELGVDR